MKTKTHQFFSTPILTILGRSGGLLIPFLIAYYYGANPATDAFFFAYGIVFAMSGLCTPIFESMLLPYLAEHKKFPDRVAGLVQSAVVVILPVVLLGTFMVWVILPPVLTKWSGLPDASVRLVTRYFLEMMPVVLFGIGVAGGNSIFYLNKLYWFPAISPLLRSAWVFLFLFVGHSSMGLHAAAGGYAVGEVLRWGIGVFLLLRFSLWKFQTYGGEAASRLKGFYGQIFYQLLALLAIHLIPLTDQWFSSWLGEGNLSFLSYADRLFQIPYQLFLAGLLQIYLSDWSEAYYEEPKPDFWKTVRRDIRRVFLLALIFSIVSILLSPFLVRLTYGWSPFSAQKMDLISKLFISYMLGFAPAVVNLLYVRVLFVMKKSALFCLQSWIKFVMNIVFNILFMHFFGLVGIALATSCVYVMTTLWLYFYLKKNWQREGLNAS